jgi:hypothetical protein
MKYEIQMPPDLRSQTKDFALEIIHRFSALSPMLEAQDLIEITGDGLNG